MQTTYNVMSGTSFLSVLNAIRKLIPNSINTIREEGWINFANSTSWSGLDSKNKWNKFRQWAIFIEVGVDYFPEVFFELKGRIISLRFSRFSWFWVDEIFLKFRIQQQFKDQTEKLAFFLYISSSNELP